MNILIIDDDNGVLNSTIRACKILGHTVFSATNGKEALQVLETNSNIDAVLSDLDMPIMNGIEFFLSVQKKFPALVERTYFWSGGSKHPQELPASRTYIKGSTSVHDIIEDIKEDIFS